MLVFVCVFGGDTTEIAHNISIFTKCFTSAPNSDGESERQAAIQASTEPEGWPIQ